MEFQLAELKKRIEASRISFIKEKIEKNAMTSKANTHHLYGLTTSKSEASIFGKNKVRSRSMQKSSVWNESCVFEGSESGFTDKDVTNFLEDDQSSGILFGNNKNGKSIVTLLKLPLVEKIPPYKTWIFLDRNQMMSEDQSVLGRRQIYYDPCGNETLICSDSEEENSELDEEKHVFSDAEDTLLWEIIQQHGLDEEVLSQLCRFINTESSQIRERYGNLMEKFNGENEKSEAFEVKEQEEKPFSYETLSAALDSFDSIFCRRCLIFDCHLHGCPETSVILSEKLCLSKPEEITKACGENCFLKSKGTVERQIASEPEVRYLNPPGQDPELGKRIYKHKNSIDFVAESIEITEKDIPGYSRKKQKVVFLVCEDVKLLNLADGKGTKRSKEKNALEIGRDFQNWSTMEKDLYLKGREIFGKNSCLIARNLLPGLKTCEEVAYFIMYSDEAATKNKSSTKSHGEEMGPSKSSEEEGSSKTRIRNRKFRSRKLKYTGKSVGCPSSRNRRIEDRKQACKQYTPCSCYPSCGKDCPCVMNGTCCEKYCGCLKCCKNRFRGCHCAKSQCRSRQCPCFAGGRECDPDVCRNCSISCGDGSLGKPPSKVEGYECGNMNLLLKQKQRILLSRSGVAGWGAFIKRPVNKNDYLGEYTGELISHKEADKRGKIYDRANSSFLFDLNDQYVLDAFRKGDKLKFANHSSNPNCYAKVMLVAGDHRVGIFAKDRIDAGEELFYDYRYGPDQAPAWARKLEGTKNRDESSTHHGRAKKIA